MVVCGSVFAAVPMERFDPVQFEQRFNKADKGKKGKLSRVEAYAEFPRMPEFFDEIDVDKDNFITLAEVQRAMERRVNAAIDSSNPATRYGSINVGKAAVAGAPAVARPQFSSKEEARRYYRSEYYESIAGSHAKADARGEPVPDLPASPVLKKSF